MDASPELAAEESAAPSSDRDLLRWAARETLPCVVTRPGRRSWGRSYVIELREDGPLPHLAVATPSDLRGGGLRPMQPGETVCLWSVRDGQPFSARGFVLGSAVVESRSAGPVPASIVRLPHRLFSSGRTLGAPVRDDAGSVCIDVAGLGHDGEQLPRTVYERWMEPRGSWASRGGAHLVEASRRSLTLSVPRATRPALLAGAQVLLGFTLADVGMRTRVFAQVVSAVTIDDHLHVGLALGGPTESSSAEEHREVVLRLAAML